jgi:hypothetical protein
MRSYDVILSKDWDQISKKNLENALDSISISWERYSPTSYTIEVSGHSKEELIKELSDCLINEKVSDKTQSIMLFGLLESYPEK